ncbi:MAG: DDE transposase [Elusimicrobia bacterium]|nr:DDE transposase [Elusimicrobiota bacterium]
MYTGKDTKTLPVLPELFPLGGGLNPENRQVKLAGLIPWDVLEQIYRSHFVEGKGRPAKESRLMIGLLLVKHIKGVSDRAVATEFLASPYIQALCGYEGFVTDERIIDPSLLSRSRKRLGKKFFEQFEQEVLAVLIARKILRPRDHMLDATIIPASIEYPTDVKLLHRCREWLCQVIRVIRTRIPGIKKIRTYARKAQKKLLQFTRSNTAQVEVLLRDWGRELARHERQFLKKRLDIVRRIYEQQRQMWREKTHMIKDRIVSLHLPHIRPMVRGKDGKDVEFGPKALLSWVNGFCFLDYLSCDAYNEGDHAVRSLRKYR